MTDTSGADVSKQSWSKLLFSFRGRIDRETYWKWFVFTTAVGIAVLSVNQLILFSVSDAARIRGIERSWAMALPGLIAVSLAIGVYWMTFALQVKRFHDRGDRGWWCLLGLIPLVGQLGVAAYLALTPGQAMANRYGKSRPDRRGFARAVALFVGGWIFIGFILYGERAFVAEPFDTPSGSNAPTLLPGDFVYTSKNLFSTRAAQYGDLVVFRHPLTGEDYIKRVVGLPGDRVQVVKGVLLVNETAWPRERIADFDERHWDEDYGRTVVERRYRYTETMPNGLKHEILGGLSNTREDSMPQDNTKVFVIPDGRFFAMGDNRDNSNDSRLQLGSVPLANIAGRAQFRYFSFEQQGSFWQFWAGIRWARLFTSIA